MSRARTANVGGRQRFGLVALRQVSSAGAAQTQWCDQDIGEISNPAAAFSNRAYVTWPAWIAVRMPMTVRAATSRHRASQSQVRAGWLRPRRARAPKTDWFGA